MWVSIGLFFCSELGFICKNGFGGLGLLFRCLVYCVGN